MKILPGFFAIISCYYLNLLPLQKHQEFCSAVAEQDTNRVANTTVVDRCGPVWSKNSSVKPYTQTPR